jgi:hypothetical protein
MITLNCVASLVSDFFDTPDMLCITFSAILFQNLAIFRIPPPPGGTAILPEDIHYYGYYYYQIIVQCLST